MALIPPDGIARLRDALISANFTSTGIADRLGPEATVAIGRDDFRAALARTTEPDPLNTLIRLFECGQTEPESAVTKAMRLDDALAAGLVEVTPDGFRAALDLEPYGDGWWIVADLPSGSRPGPLPADHVLGVGGASSTLANAIVRSPVGSALDLGTGCGVQALHLFTHAERVVVTDVSSRALTFAETTAGLSGQHWELRRGDMVEPVHGEGFDLVVSNPPFVAGPGVATHTYRDSGRPGDAISAELAVASSHLLNPGGTLQFLGNWLHVAGEDWAERVAGWFTGTGMDVWAIEREFTDPLSYVRLWLADAAEEHDPHRIATWLDWFDAHKVDGVGFGLITAKNNHHDHPLVRVETLHQPLAQPFGPEVIAWFARQDWLRDVSGDDRLLGAAYRAAPGLTLHQEAGIGTDGWDVTRQRLVQTEGLRWSEEVDPILLALVGGCDGTVALRDQLAVLAVAYQVPEPLLAQMAGVIVPHLVERGFITPTDGTTSAR